MGGGLTGVGLAFIILIIVAVVAVIWVAPLARSRQRKSNVINAERTPTLEYRVPEGQDPAAVMAALSHDGYDAAVDPTDTQLVRIHCPAGPDRDRARVRSIIEQVPATGIDANVPLETHRIRFVDER